MGMTNNVNAANISFGCYIVLVFTWSKNMEGQMKVPIVLVSIIILICFAFIVHDIFSSHSSIKYELLYTKNHGKVQDVEFVSHPGGCSRGVTYTIFKFKGGFVWFDNILDLTFDQDVYTRLYERVGDDKSENARYKRCICQMNLELARELCFCSYVGLGDKVVLTNDRQ
jgi:hypothetical protein